MAKTVAEFLKTAGLKVTEPAPKVAAAAPAAPAKVAEMPPALAAALAKKGDDKGDDKKEDKKEDEMKKEDDKKEASLTDAQKWLAERGVTIADAKLAEAFYARETKIAELEKNAELEKLAEEERARGAIFLQGMTREQTALKLAFGQCTVEDAQKIAYAMGFDAASIIKRAEEMESAVRTSSPALVGNDLGRAARHDDSAAAAAAEAANTTKHFKVEGQSGTRPAVSGQDEKTMRFTDVWSLPNNPGLNLGQPVDQGKGL